MVDFGFEFESFCSWCIYICGGCIVFECFEDVGVDCLGNFVYGYVWFVEVVGIGGNYGNVV